MSFDRIEAAARARDEHYQKVSADFLAAFSRLDELRVTIDVGVDMGDYEQDGGHRYLHWGAIDGCWQFVISCTWLDGRIRRWPYAYESMEIRVIAHKHLPELIDKIAEELERQVVEMKS